MSRMVAGYIEAPVNQFGRKNTFFLNIARNNRCFYKKNVGTVCTPSPQNNEFKMITNYIVLAHVSFKATVRLKTK